MMESSSPQRSRSETRPAPPRARLAAVLIAAVAVAALAGARAVRAGTESEIPVFALFLDTPDVTVIGLSGIINHGAVGGVRAYSIGTVACNSGTAPLEWCNESGGCGNGTTDDDHPVIAQNLYRLEGGRFQQIGMSWLKHGFNSTNDPDPGCGTCVQPPLASDQLGVGCTDTYSAGLNGMRPLGMRSEVDAASGTFSYPFTEKASEDRTSQRLRVAESDLDPALHPGARYFMEAHYVAADDAAAYNGFNNASHREITVAGGSFDLSFSGGTVRELPAIAAWALADPEVDLVPLQVPASGPPERFHVARKATPLGGGDWHYEYAVHNLDSDRSANRFTISFPGGVAISTPGFQSVAHHSGEPYATDPWVADLSTPGAVTWSTAGFGTDPNANALRWGTTFSFWFDATAGPQGITHTLGLFKPGSPGQIVFPIATGD